VRLSASFVTGIIAFSTRRVAASSSILRAYRFLMDLDPVIRLAKVLHLGEEVTDPLSRFLRSPCFL
jgi:hypothetical protein